MLVGLLLNMRSRLRKASANPLEGTTTASGTISRCLKTLSHLSPRLWRGPRRKKSAYTRRSWWTTWLNKSKMSRNVSKIKHRSRVDLGKDALQIKTPQKYYKLTQIAPTSLLNLIGNPYNDPNIKSTRSDPYRTLFVSNLV